MKTAPSATSAPTCLLLNVIVATALLIAFPDERAQASPSTVVGFDMVVDDDGDSIPDNKATAVGLVQSCVHANPGDEITIDSVVNQIPEGRDLARFTYRITFNASIFSTRASVHTDPSINLLASNPGSNVAIVYNAETDGVSLTAEDWAQPERGPARGVLGRYFIDISADAASGVYDLSLEQALLLDSQTKEIPQSAGTLSRQIAIGVSACPAPAEPTPTPAPTPVPTESPPPSPEPPAVSPDPSTISDLTHTPSLEAAPMQDLPVPLIDDPSGRFLYSPLGFRTTITSFFDHTNPRQRDGKIQVYSGAIGTKNTNCDEMMGAYWSGTAGRCLYYDGHAGYDYALSAEGETPVRAAANGCAMDVNWAAPYGLRVVLQHYNGYRTLYAHLDHTKPHISEKQCVHAGDEIAFGGNSGCQCGRHLHFSVFDPSGQVTDPYGWWGSKADPWQPTSKWLWLVEQPTTNSFPTTKHEEPPWPNDGAHLPRNGGPCLNSLHRPGGDPAFLVTSTLFPGKAQPGRDPSPSVRIIAFPSRCDQPEARGDGESRPLCAMCHRGPGQAGDEGRRLRGTEQRWWLEHGVGRFQSPGAPG